MIENQLTAKILKNKKANELTIVSICGAADLGKSFLSSQIYQSLISRKIHASHLTLDSYLVDREVRKEKGISGYNIEAYNLNKALTDLTSLKNGASIDFCPYAHMEGKSSSNSYKMGPSEVLIFDGLHSMHPAFTAYVDFTIFIYTRDDYLKTIRMEADRQKRNYSASYAKTISESELIRYKFNVELYKEKADCLLYLNERWDYQIMER